MTKCKNKNADKPSVYQHFLNLSHFLKNAPEENRTRSKVLKSIGKSTFSKIRVIFRVIFGRNIHLL
jgi:hypothetical protein